jgi:hypothetical protein
MDLDEGEHADNCTAADERALSGNGASTARPDDLLMALTGAIARQPAPQVRPRRALCCRHISKPIQWLVTCRLLLCLSHQ